MKKFEAAAFKEIWLLGENMKLQGDNNPSKYFHEEELVNNSNYIIKFNILNKFWNHLGTYYSYGY